jgi:hypothetical protein
LINLLQLAIEIYSTIQDATSSTFKKKSKIQHKKSVGESIWWAKIKRIRRPTNPLKTKARGKTYSAVLLRFCQE